MAQSPDFLVRGLGGSETRNQAQKPAHKDIRPKWQNQPLGLMPLMLRFLTASDCALQKKRKIQSFPPIRERLDKAL
jgi:hypothetical protein